MKIITATMAKNIANDFMNNACGPRIKDTMDKILLAAERGHHETMMLIPTDWDSTTRSNVAMFFGGLDYKVEIHPTAITIKW
jgi:hypothetical protein